MKYFLNNIKGQWKKRKIGTENTKFLKEKWNYYVQQDTV